MSENITTDTPNKAKQKRTRTHTYLQQRHQGGIGGHGGAQCGHVADLVAAKTNKTTALVSRPSKKYIISTQLQTHSSVVSVALVARATPSADTSLIWL